MILALDHVQLAMPPGGEDAARGFYRDVLGMTEETKPPVLAARGGCWFVHGSARLHLGVEADFLPAKKAHPALLVADLAVFCAHLRGLGVTVTEDNELPDLPRANLLDPFGNRIELVGAG